MTAGPSLILDGGFGAARRMSTNNRIRVMIGLPVLPKLYSAGSRARDYADADETT